MSVYSLMVCDRCLAARRLPHAASPREHARIWHHWVTVADQGETTDLCPDCGRDV